MNEERTPIRFGRVLDENELLNRISELTPEQFQAVVQLVQMSIEQVGSIIDHPKLDPLETKHFAGGLYWLRNLLQRFIDLRTPPRPPEVPEIVLEI